MGYMKDLMMQQESQGWSFIGDKFVCAKCFDDYALERFVRANAVEKTCGYCGRTSKTRPIAAPIDDIMPEISAGILSEWRNPDDVGVPYESAEGGYQGKVIDTYDLINDELWDVFIDESLRQDIIDAFDAQGAMWCDRHFWTLPPQEALRYGWEEFAKLVKHSTRYFFLKAPEDKDEYGGYEEIPPHLFLQNLGEVVEETGLVRMLPSNTRLFRARVHDRSKTLQNASDLGPPPVDKAVYSNRMSPAGISMFYGTFDRKTAIAETLDNSVKPGELITTAVFETARTFPILDLTKLPKIPSIFDSEERYKRPGIIFLRGFSTDLSKRITKDGREHIEYVPTQVVTEYFQNVYIDHELGKIHGILYKSSQNPNGKCCVMFFQNEQCCEITPNWNSATMEYRPSEPQYWLGLDPVSFSVFDPYSKRNKRAESHFKQKRQIPKKV